MKRKLFRKLSVVIALLSVIFLFSACSKSKAEKPEPAPDASKPTSAATEAAGKDSEVKNEKPVSITIWTSLQVEADTLQKYADEWSEKTGNTAKVINEVADVQQFAQAVKGADGPDAVYGIANDQLANFISAGLAQEVPQELYSDSDYVSAAAQACYADGKRYGVPIAVETNTLFYNTDKIKEAPKTWDELIELAKSNGGIKFEATSIYYDLGFLRAYDSYIFKYDNGAYDATDIGLGNENAVKAYQYISDLANKYGFIASDTSSDLARSAFQNGETAFYIGGPWDIDGFNEVGIKYAVAPMPTLEGKNFVTPVGTQVGFVSSKSKKQEATWDFFKYLMENAGVELYKAGGRIPASLKVQESIDADTNTKAFITQISYGEPMPTVAELGQVWTPYSDNMKLMFTGTITPEKAAENIAKQVQEGIALMNSGK